MQQKVQFFTSSYTSNFTLINLLFILLVFTEIYNVLRSNLFGKGSDLQDFSEIHLATFHFSKFTQTLKIEIELILNFIYFFLTHCTFQDFRVYEAITSINSNQYSGASSEDGCAVGRRSPRTTASPHS